MYEWVLLRVVILGLLLTGGLLFALAGSAMGRWRKRRGSESAGRKSADSVAKQCGNLNELDRSRLRRARSFEEYAKSEPATAKSRAELKLTHITTREFPRSVQTIGSNGRH